MPKSTATEKLLKPKEVSELTGLSLSTIYAGLCETNTLRRIKLRSTAKGRATLRFYESDVRLWIAKRVETAQPEPVKQPRRITAADRLIDLAQYKRSRER